MKNLKKGIRRILAMALSTCMIAGCLAMVPVGGAKAATTLYYNIARDNRTSFSAGEYIYISKQNLADPTYASTAFPSVLDAQLEITGEKVEDGLGINVIKKAPSFDSCPGKKIVYKNGAWYYWCINGGVTDDGPFYVYTVSQGIFNAKDITVSVGQTPAGGKGNVSNVTVNIAMDGKNFNIKDASMVDLYVDPAEGDSSITVNVGGESVTKVLPQAGKAVITGLENLSDTEKDDFKTRLDSATTNEAIKAIIDEAKAKDAENLANKKESNANAIDNAAKSAKDAIDALKDLSDPEKDAKKQAVDDAATAAKNAITGAKNVAAADKELTDGTNAINAIKKEAEDLNALNEAKRLAKAELDIAAKETKDAIDALKDLSDEEKAAKKTAIADAVTQAKKDIDAKQNISDVKKVKDDAKGVIDDIELSAVKDDTKAAIAKDAAAKKDAISKLDNLTDDEKQVAIDAIDDAVIAANDAIDKARDEAGVTTAKDTYDTAAALAVAKINAVKEINEYAKTKKDAIDALENLSDEEKAAKKKDVDSAASDAKGAINAATTTDDVTVAKDAGIAATDLILDKAKAINTVRKQEADLIEYVNKLPNLSDEAKAEFVEGNEEVSGIKEWTQALIDDIDKADNVADIVNCVNDHKKQVALATKLANAADFIAGYLTADKETLYTYVNRTNIDQILSGQDVWASFVEDEEGNCIEREFINEVIAAETDGKYLCYEDYIADARKFVKEQTDKFIKDYVSDKDGNIYKEADASNYAQILSGKAEWDQMSKAEQDMINERLVANGSKPYPELLKLAEAVKKQTDDFIKKYVSDDKGNIYKTATKDNYKQILSGKAEWNRKSQAEKDAINAILLANGGKTYEELLKLAEKIAADVAKTAKTGDNAPIAFYLLLMMLSMSGAAVVERKKKMI